MRTYNAHWIILWFFFLLYTIFHQHCDDRKSVSIIKKKTVLHSRRANTSHTMKWSKKIKEIFQSLDESQNDRIISLFIDARFAHSCCCSINLINNLKYHATLQLLTFSLRFLPLHVCYHSNHRNHLSRHAGYARRSENC